MAVLEKKALAAHKQNFDLHVLLIMKQEKVTKAQAMVNAYHEGLDYLAERMNPRQAEMPLGGKK